MTQELQAREKVAVAAEGEQTRTRPVFVPAVDIHESPDSLTLLADLPGVVKDGLFIDLKDNVLTIRGEVRAAARTGAHVIYREYNDGDYFRQFTLSNAIAQDRITAALKDGVLTLNLPKADRAKPRQIEIHAE